MHRSNVRDSGGQDTLGQLQGLRVDIADPLQGTVPTAFTIVPTQASEAFDGDLTTLGDLSSQGNFPNQDFTFYGAEPFLLTDYCGR